MKSGELRELLARLEAAREARYREHAIRDLRVLVDQAEGGNWRAVEQADELVEVFNLRPVEKPRRRRGHP